MGLPAKPHRPGILGGYLQPQAFDRGVRAGHRHLRQTGDRHTSGNVSAA